MICPVSALEERLSGGNGVLLDCAALEQFLRARIRGAVPFPPWIPLTLKGPHSKLVADPEHFEKLASYLQLATADAPITVYDTGEVGSTTASRVAWVLALYGYDAKLLNGGWRAFVKTLGGPVDEGAPDHPLTPATEEVPARPMNRTVLATIDDLAADVHKAAGSRTLQLVDVRTPAEYSGADPKANRRSGHVPGAVNIPHGTLYAPDGCFKSAAELRELFLRAGLNPERPVVTYCQAGIRAAVGFAALREAGFPHVKNYDGSMGEWLNSDRPDAVVER